MSIHLTIFKRTLTSLVLYAMVTASGVANAQQDQGRVISSEPSPSGYSVLFEYAGRQYATTTRTPLAPGAAISINVSPVIDNTPPAQLVPVYYPQPVEMPPRYYVEASPWPLTLATAGIAFLLGGAILNGGGGGHGRH